MQLLGAAAGRFRPTISFKQFDTNQDKVAAALSRTPAATLAILAGRAGLSEPATSTALEVLDKAHLVKTDAGYELTDRGREVSKRTKNWLYARVDGPPDRVTVAWIATGTIAGVQIPTIAPWFWPEVDLPSGLITAEAIPVFVDQTEQVKTDQTDLSNKFDIPIATRPYRVIFEPQTVSFAGEGIDVSGHISLNWADVLERRSKVQIHIVDVGYGNAVWIRTPETAEIPAKNIIIDGGPTADSGTAYELRNHFLKFLVSNGLPEGSMIDYVILSNPRSEHRVGLLDVLHRYHIRNIAEPGYGNSFGLRRFRRAAHEATADATSSHYFDLHKEALPLDLGPFASAKVLYTDGAGDVNAGRGSKRTKNGSVVLQGQIGGRSFLLMSDALGRAAKDGLI